MLVNSLGFNSRVWSALVSLFEVTSSCGVYY